MATTVYSAWSGGWTPSGSSISKKYRAKIVYSTSSTNTSVSLTVSLAVNINSSVGATFDGDIHEGNSASSIVYNGWQHYGTKKTIFGESNTVTIISNKTHTYARKVSAYTVNFYGSVSSENGSWTGVEKGSKVSITIPALPSYNVTFNSNGGTGGVSQTLIKRYGITAYLPSSEHNPQRQYYTFKEWNTAQNGTGTSYQPGQAYTANAGATLYAQWEPLSWSITYDSNGGTGTGSDVKIADVPLLLSDGAGFTKSDQDAYYVISGWNTEPDGSGTAYGLSQNYMENGDDATLYAQWKINYTPPVIYNAEAFRVDNDGDKSDAGDKIRVKFNYIFGKSTKDEAPDKFYSSNCMITIDNTVVYNATLSAPDPDNPFSTIPAITYSTEDSHFVIVTLSDIYGQIDISESFDIPSAVFPIDLIADSNNHVHMGIMHIADATKSLIMPTINVDGDVYIRESAYKVPVIFIENTAPTSADGENGDVWLQYT